MLFFFSSVSGVFKSMKGICKDRMDQRSSSAWFAVELFFWQVLRCRINSMTFSGKLNIEK